MDRWVVQAGNGQSEGPRKNKQAGWACALLTPIQVQHSSRQPRTPADAARTQARDLLLGQAGSHLGFLRACNIRLVEHIAPPTCRHACAGGPHTRHDHAGTLPTCSAAQHSTEQNSGASLLQGREAQAVNKQVRAHHGNSEAVRCATGPCWSRQAHTAAVHSALLGPLCTTTVCTLTKWQGPPRNSQELRLPFLPSLLTLAQQGTTPSHAPGPTLQPQN